MNNPKIPWLVYGVRLLFFEEDAEHIYAMYDQAGENEYFRDRPLEQALASSREDFFRSSTLRKEIRSPLEYAAEDPQFSPFMDNAFGQGLHDNLMLSQQGWWDISYLIAADDDGSFDDGNEDNEKDEEWLYQHNKAMSGSEDGYVEGDIGEDGFYDLDRYTEAFKDMGKYPRVISSRFLDYQGRGLEQEYQRGLIEGIEVCDMIMSIFYKRFAREQDADSLPGMNGARYLGLALLFRHDQAMVNKAMWLSKTKRLRKWYLQPRVQGFLDYVASPEMDPERVVPVEGSAPHHLGFAKNPAYHKGAREAQQALKNVMADYLFDAT